MKKILIFGAFLGVFACASAVSAVRDGTSLSTIARTPAVPQSRTTTVLRSNSDSARAAAPTRTQNTTIKTRAGTIPIITSRPTTTRGATYRPPRNKTVATRAAISRPTAVSARAATMSETKTGAAYNQCKSAYFQCMDQFCLLKNDEYRRCSCSSRINDLIAVRKNLIDTNTQLSEFTENLDVVGMTAAQATAMHTASDGENALTRDVSASKALLTAIMNSIRGEDATVGGTMSDLNSINLSFDTANMFGLTDTAQLIASYNGVDLYNAVYPSCRSVVGDDCNDASLQRAVTAYLMAIEQDCNTVQTALTNKQRELKSAIREGDAMLDLARIENRQKHNSDDMTTCINNVQSAVLSEQVCGANYHKCLDNGEFIDISTGAPIAGVANFRELGNLLKFDYGVDAVDQKLSQNPNNQKFLKNFENKTKKFAEPALDKCSEISDAVWSEYLDKALLDIYYAQQSKVKTIQNGCFDLISSCYSDRETAITAAMAALIDGDTDISLTPDKIVLTKQMCSNYIDSCNGMFGDDIVAQYIDAQTSTDTLAACRAVAQNCFDEFGGTNYENFYSPSSGLFKANVVDTAASTNVLRTALDWFTLYEYDENGNRLPGYKSVCAQRVADISSCTNQIEEIFGGLDVTPAQQTISTYGQYKYTKPIGNKDDILAYGWAMRDTQGLIDWDDATYQFKNRRLRPTGIATEVYNQIIDGLITQCTNVQGKFIEAQFIDHDRYGRLSHSSCDIDWQYFETTYGREIGNKYGSVSDFENMCPKDYTLNIDTNAWGTCLCWENGGRRSKNGKFGKCVNAIPLTTPQGSSDDLPNDGACDEYEDYSTGNNDPDIKDWCTSTINKNTNQVCPFDTQNDNCAIPDKLPDGIL